MMRRKMSDLPSSHGGMEDVNEQELARATGEQFFGESKEDTDKAEELFVPSFDSAFENIKKEEIPLPVIQKEPEGIVEVDKTEQPEEEIKQEEVDEPTEESEDNIPSENPPEPRRKPKQKGEKLYIGIIAVCLVLAVVLSLFSAYGTREPLNGEDEESEEETQSEEPAPTPITPSGDILSAQEIYRTKRNMSVTVTAIKSGNKEVFSGTAVFSDGYIATVYEAISEAERIEVTLSDGSTHAAAVVGGDSLTDIALLKTEGLELEYAQAASVSFEAGKRLYAIGTAEQIQFGGSLFEGVVAFGERTVELLGEGERLRRATAVQVGSFCDAALRGSPVFDEQGNAVAMVWGLTDGGSVGLVLPLERVLAVAEFFKNGEAPTLEVLRTIAYTAPSLGISGQNGMAGDVCGVIINDFSEPTCDAAIKLRRGDVIVKIGEVLTPDTAAVKEAIYTMAPNDKVEVHVVRGEQRLSYFVTLI